MDTAHSLLLMAAIWTACDGVDAGSEWSNSRAQPEKRAKTTPEPALEGKAVVDFWRAAGPGIWLRSSDGALGLVLLLDQYPRNSFRGTPRMYATDAQARSVADSAIAAGHDRRVDEAMQFFFYLPFGHSENLADQERSVELTRRLGQPTLSHAEGHRDIVRLARSGWRLLRLSCPAAK
jgi:uncharacterized protein (DUF924 family)